MPNSIYNIHNPNPYLTCLRIGFNYLKEHKFKYDFQDSIDSICSYSSGIEIKNHFFSIAQILLLKNKPSLTK